jgi:Branched-chain amino acid aminotransferase/4-amino-4-deoxychorismate lyase
MSPDPIPYDAPVVERGFGFFETLLLVGRRAVLWDAHLRRLLATLEALELPAPSGDAVESAARALSAESPTGTTSAPCASPGSRSVTTSRKRPPGASTRRSGRSRRTPSREGRARGL